jgi:hypothetical protein
MKKDAATEPGVRGRIVGTGITDHVVCFCSSCDSATHEGFGYKSCVRLRPLIRSIEWPWPSGHLVATDGSRGMTTALNLHDTRTQVLRFLCFQDIPGRARLLVVRTVSFGDTDVARIPATIRARRVGRVREVRVSPSGKVLDLDQRVPARPVRSA